MQQLRSRVNSVWVVVSALVCILVCLLAVPAIGFRCWRWHKKQLLFRANHQAILLACRQVIRDREMYSGYPWKLSYLPAATNWYLLSGRDILTNPVPQAIRDLGPRDLVVGSNIVQIYTHTPRVSLLAFAEGAPQFGTVKLIDGLWYWDGTQPGRKYGEPVRYEIPSQSTNETVRQR
jgi:hypothetical protein